MEQQTVSERHVVRPLDADATLNNVNHQPLDLYPRRNFFQVTGYHDISLLPANPTADFWRSSQIGKLAIQWWREIEAPVLDCEAWARHDFGVRPAIKTLGDILYADKSKLRVPEEEWLKLIRAIAGGDQLALHSLFEQTNRIVFTLIVRITMNRETAEEVTLDVFYDVWRKASTYDPANGSVVGWVMNQARSRAIDRLRFDQRKKRVNTYPLSLRPETDIVDPQQACLFEEQSRLLRDALEVLTPEEQKAIETAFFSELTYEQTARKLNQPLGTVKTRIRSGLEKLREGLGTKVKATG
jgi:RNA polymerase sigma-70 factor, ECF subfamily